MYEELVGQMTETLKYLVEYGDEAIELQAKMCRKCFDALVAEGFSPDHACLIVAHRGAGIDIK